MKILVDENIPRMTVVEMERLGHDVRDIRATDLQGLSDDRLWEEARREGRLLITTDKAFSLLREEPHHGILIVRLRQPTRMKIHTRILRALARYSADDWPGLLLVMRDAVQTVWRRHEGRGRKGGRRPRGGGSVE